MCRQVKNGTTPELFVVKPSGHGRSLHGPRSVEEIYARLMTKKKETKINLNICRIVDTEKMQNMDRTARLNVEQTLTRLKRIALAGQVGRDTSETR